MANCISVQCKILCYHFFSGLLSFLFIGMGPTDFQQSWVFIISLEGRFSSEKSLSLFQHQIMSGSELPTSTFFPGSFFALLHSPSSNYLYFNLGCGETIRNNLPFCFFHEIWKKPLQEKREVSELKLFRVCSYLVSTELRWGAELLDLRTFPWETVLALGSWYLGINRSRQGNGQRFLRGC